MTWRDDPADNRADTKLVVGSAATVRATGYCPRLPDLWRRQGQDEELCGTCRYAADERAGMQMDEEEQPWSEAI